MTSLLKPILLTGAHLSGVKALAEIVAICPTIKYEKNPFAIQESNNEYIFVTKENEEILKSMNPLLDKDVKPEKKFLSGIFAEIGAYFKILSAEKKGHRMMVADTKLFFMAPWIHKKFNADVLVLLRHPLALASIQKKENYRLDFNFLLQQEDYVAKFMPHLATKIKYYAQNEHSITENAAFSWLIFATLFTFYQREYSNWIFFKTEVFDMQRKFRECYQMLDIPFSKEIGEKIVNYRENLVSNDPRMILEYNEWNNLEAQEIVGIKKICGDTYDHFYNF